MIWGYLLAKVMLFFWIASFCFMPHNDRETTSLDCFVPRNDAKRRPNCIASLAMSYSILFANNVDSKM